MHTKKIFAENRTFFQKLLMHALILVFEQIKMLKVRKSIKEDWTSLPFLVISGTSFVVAILDACKLNSIRARISKFFIFKRRLLCVKKCLYYGLHCLAF